MCVLLHHVKHLKAVPNKHHITNLHSNTLIKTLLLVHLETWGKVSCYKFHNIENESRISFSNSYTGYAQPLAPWIYSRAPGNKCSLWLVQGRPKPTFFISPLSSNYTPKFQKKQKTPRNLVTVFSLVEIYFYWNW